MLATGRKYASILVFMILLSIAAYFWFINSPYFAITKTWALKHSIAYWLVLTAVKTIGIVWPPIPGGTLTLASIPIIGWKSAYSSDLAGSTIGSMTAYWLGKKYGQAFLNKFISDDITTKISSVKFAKGKEIGAIFMTRLAGGGLAIEVLSYAAGLVGIGYKRFLIGIVLAHVVLNFPLYFLAGVWTTANSTLLSVVAAVIFIPFFLKFWKRFFE
ncbi:VTT domain-containing protein [candidate division WWE3 bacterium]|nr:VTT domain-containing protein [candidate division WWE3 bacterium]